MSDNKPSSQDGKPEGGGDPVGDWTRMMAGPFADMMGGPMRDLMEMQAKTARDMFAMFMPGADDAAKNSGMDAANEAMRAWQDMASDMQATWATMLADNPATGASPFGDPQKFLDVSGKWMEASPIADEALQKKLMDDAVKLWSAVLEGMTPDGADGAGKIDLPHSDRRFSDPKWRELPFHTLIHQSYLAMAEQMMAAAERPAAGMSEEAHDKMKFCTRLVVEALSPAHFPLTNPLVMEKTIASGGRNLVKGMEHLVKDMKAGQLTHTDSAAFELGRDIAATPGHVVFETDLFQLIHYTPTTEEVLEVPLVIFPPWINRYYILDLGKKKSFIAWAVDQGISTFIVSWKSADASMAEIGWEDYIAAQEAAIDHVRERLDVPAVHTIGYCVAGTTLAATLSVLARRKEADKVKSATFFTAQVDFSEAGELNFFIDEQQMAAIDTMSSEGFVDGRYLAAAFNLLRSPDLIWSYVIRNYLLGEDYAAFDLLHWNGDTTNLPARFHREYLKNLYHENRLVIPDRLSANGTPIDLRRIETPAYIQAGREDHIAPAKSVWKMTRHLSGPVRFMLAGSGHIAGVVNPPASGKYQYWTIDAVGEESELPDTLDEFVASANETAGSWWPDWLEWIRSHDPATVPATGKRKPGGKGDKTVEPAPGRYVRTR